MVQSPEERQNTLRRSLSQSEGDAHKISDGLNPNAEVQQRAMQRYQKLLKGDKQVQEHAYDHEAVDWLMENCPTVVQMFEGLCKVYADRTMFGFCDPGSDQWQTITYRQFHERVVQFSAGLQAIKAFKREDFVGVCGFSSLDWVTSDFTDCYSGVTTVPLPTNIQAEDIVKIINEAEITCLIVSMAELGNLAHLVGGCHTVKTFVAMDLPAHMDEETKSLLKKTQESLPSGCQLYMLPEVLAKGKGSPAPRPAIPGQDGVAEDPLYSLFYTSGSTGLPKGAAFKEKMWLKYWHKAADVTNMNTASIQLGFLPLNHIMARLSMNQCLMAGGSMWFVRKSDMSTFFDDIKTVRPTSLMLIPRIANMIYDQAQEKLRKAGDSDKQAVIEDFRNHELGGRVFSALTGSAPTAPEVVDFLRDSLIVPIYEGYGSTEAGIITRDGEITPSVKEWKLVDVPELGYFTSDKPFPRGELLVLTDTMIDGYYKHQDKWEEMLKDSFMETGDVMEQRGPNTVVWIDRKKNIMKLSQGEFVSVGRLEATYSGNSDLINQMYIYGSGLRSYLLAVVVPSEVATSQYSGADLKKALRRNIDDLARTKALQGYEIPRDFIVEMDPFSKANHLLTDSGKPARGKLKSKYAPTLEDIYTQMEQRQKERQNAMRDAAAQGSISDKVKQAASVTLGIDPAEMGDGSSSFNQLGGDSLAAIQFAREVDELCGTTLPVSFVLDHSHSIQDIIEKVESLLKGDAPDAITFEKIHGRNGKMIKAKDLDLLRFAPRGLPPEVTDAVGIEELPAEPEKVLLTGANGFLGRFLLLDFLKRVSTKKGGVVVAIVRAHGDDAAYSRLRAGYDSGDAELLKAFDNLAKDHLKVYAGDLSKPNLGLKPDVYRELATTLDTVIHNGALVNHAFTYEQLFEPNVLGSLEVMKMAVRYKRKAMTFVSSVGVAMSLGKTGVKEDSLGTNIAEEFPGSDGYAVGYGCSKWATEVQLQQLNSYFGVPVSVFRCGMILAHSKYLGQQNPTDNFTRLLASLVYTGIAPESFYKDPNGPDRHYDGMPVDFVAEAIAGISSAQRRGIGLYHVVNPHWNDNVSLDSFLGWVEGCGYPLKRIPDYTQWYQQFKGALEKLDSKLASNSSLPIVYMWEHPMSGPVTKLDATQLRTKAAETTHWKDVPHLDEAFIRQNMKDLVALQIIGPPGQPHPQSKAAGR